MQPFDAEDELDLRRYLDVVSRRKWVIVAAVMVVTAIAVALSLDPPMQ